MDEDTKRLAGGICIRNGAILLVHRINKERDFNQEYFIFPGGPVRGGTNIETTLLQEFRDLSIQVTLGSMMCAIEKNEDEEIECYYICNYISGELPLNPTISAEDMQQFYTPMWVPLKEIDDLMLYPEVIKDMVVNLIDSN